MSSLQHLQSKARDMVSDTNWRSYVPPDAMRYLDRATAVMEEQYKHHETELGRLDEHFSTIAKVLLIAWIIDRWLAPGWRNLWAKGVTGSIVAIYSYVQDILVGVFLRLPFVSSKVASELAVLRKDLSAKVAPKTFPDGIQVTTVRTLPEKGRNKAWLEEEWRNLKKMERGDVDSGRVSGTVYHGGQELTEIINEAMAKFTVSNPLHPDVFPGVRKMEAEIVSMCLDLFHGPQGAGTTTSGGTESILMSVKTHRDWARATKGITEPELVIPSSAHAAFWKACEYFKIKLHVIPVDEKTRQADVKRMARAVNVNTIMIVGSAPNFPDGAVDPIPALGKLAKRNNVGLHVDCCLGSFIMPFLNRAGFVREVEPFDFAVEGVTAISCDIHKYAFCPKGSSVIMYRSPELRRYQYYVITDWAGGVYASPSMAGSRPGSILAGAWAVMNHVGADGYTSACQAIVSAARVFSTELRHRFADDLYVLGDPKVSVVAFGSKSLNVYAIGDRMSKRGWHLNALQNPPALHMAFTRLTAMSVEKLLADLAQAVEEVKAASKDAKGDEGQMVALYGMGQTSVGPYVVGKAAEIFLDVLYE